MNRILTISIATIFGTATLQAADLSSALEAISNVSAEGRGHEQAISAWQSLAKATPDQITVLLGAIREDNPLANNWIRSAVETVASRSIKKTGSLPAADLEAFLMDRERNPRARRLAYELIQQVDEDAEARLIPKMLDDPSVELRRDAV